MRSLLHIVFGCLLALGGQASAGNFDVNPTKVSLSSSAPTSSITLTNTTDEATTIRAEVMLWTQRNGEDILTPATDVLAVPPLFTLTPNGKQVVRLALRNRADSGNEKSYRIILQEVPSSQQASSGASGTVTLKVQLRVSVPIFVTTAAPVIKKAEWQALLTENSVLLRLHNRGNTHVQVTQLRLTQQGIETPIINQSVFGYALPGETREWKFPIPEGLKAGASLTLTATTTGGVTNANLVLAP